jgi:hypothetical protein
MMRLLLLSILTTDQAHMARYFRKVYDWDLPCMFAAIQTNKQTSADASAACAASATSATSAASVASAASAATVDENRLFVILWIKRRQR